MTNAESAQGNLHKIVTVLGDHLSKEASDHFCLSLKWQNACLNQPLKTLSIKEMQNKHKEQCIKNKHLPGYIYSIETL